MTEQADGIVYDFTDQVTGYRLRVEATGRVPGGVILDISDYRVLLTTWELPHLMRALRDATARRYGAWGEEEP